MIRPHKRQKTLEGFWSPTSKKPSMADGRLVEEIPDTGGIHLATTAGEQESTGGTLQSVSPSPKAAPCDHITVATVNNPAPREETVFVADVPVDEHKGALRSLNEYLVTLKDVSCTKKDHDVFNDLLKLA